MADFHYVRPDEMFTLDGTVTGGADTNYQDEWLVDGRPGRPVRGTSGTVSWTITNPSKTCSLAAVCNHNVDASRSITLSGGLSMTLTGPALQANSIPLNPWGTVSESSISTQTIAISSNSVPVVIGEFVVGKKRSLERTLRVKPTFSQRYLVTSHEAEFDSLMPYDKAIVARELTGEVIVTDAGLADIQAWVDSTRGGSKLTLIVPDADVQDAWLVTITEFSYQPDANNVNFVSLGFREFPRSRW